MLTSLNRLIGTPAVWQDRRVGLVENAEADWKSGTLGGVLVRKGLGGARWVPGEEILLAGERCIVLHAKPGRLPPSRSQGFGHAFLSTGESAGEVTDVFLLGDSLRIAALEISPGPFYRLMGRCAYAAEYRLAAGGVMVPQLLTWAQLMSRLKEECT